MDNLIIEYSLFSVSGQCNYIMQCGFGKYVWFIGFVVYPRIEAEVDIALWRIKRK